MRTWVSGMIVLGFALTAGNGIGAYRSAQKRLRHLGQRLTHSDHYTDEARNAPITMEKSPPASYSAHDGANMVLHALRASRTNLMLAGLGLLFSAAGSLWGLYL